MDIFFRQMWQDKRLSYDGVSELVIGSDMLHKIWIPDTFIANDRKTYFHKATVQNKFIRIQPDGQVLYSMRCVMVYFSDYTSSNIIHLLAYTVIV